jgi:catechol 2,3-dioxygenase-like lactoylglutathione lyase family enzyme
MIGRLNHVAIAVPDLAAATQVYRDTLGARVSEAVDQPEHLRVLVGALRKKIEPNPSSPKYILTEPWVGYRFADV